MASSGISATRQAALKVPPTLYVPTLNADFIVNDPIVSENQLERRHLADLLVSVLPGRVAALAGSLVRAYGDLADDHPMVSGYWMVISALGGLDVNVRSVLGRDTGDLGDIVGALCHDYLRVAGESGSRAALLSDRLLTASDAVVKRLLTLSPISVRYLLADELLIMARVLRRMLGALTSASAAVQLAVNAAVGSDASTFDRLVACNSLPRRSPDIALLVACLSGNTIAVQSLLNAVPRSRMSLALRAAVVGRHAHVVDMLLGRDGVDAGDKDGWALFAAVERGSLPIVQRLLADPLCIRADAHNSLALVVAASKGQADVMRHLLSNRLTRANAVDSWALRVAANNGQVEAVRILLGTTSVDPTANDSEALWRAAGNGRADVVSELLRDRRADPGARGGLALALAAAMGHDAVVDVLLRDERVDVSTNWYAALRAAISGQNVACVDRILQEEGVRDALDASFAWPSIPQSLRDAIGAIARECDDTVSERNWADDAIWPNWQCTSPSVIIRLLRAGLAFQDDEHRRPNRWQRTAVSSARRHLRHARDAAVRTIARLATPRSRLPLPDSIRALIALFWIPDHHGLEAFTDADRRREVDRIAGRIRTRLRAER